MQIFKKGKGNKAIDKTNAKRIENGKIILDLPLVPFNGKIVPLFQVISPTVGPGESLKAYSEQLWSSSDSSVLLEIFMRKILFGHHSYREKQLTN